jgi:tetratricopeptide (TPR) repeat protein
MKALVGTIVGLALAGSAAAAPNAASEADRLFFAGDFARAQTLYEAVPSWSPRYEAARRQLGAIALYENRLDEAEQALRLAVLQDPADTKADLLLAEAASRRGNFAGAATWLRQAGRSERADAAAYEAFGNAQPYRITSAEKGARLPFVQTDPLPAVEMSVNGVRGLFLVDTGAAEIVLDPAFAAKADVAGSGGDTGLFAGGRTANITYARIGEIALGSLEVADVPALLLSTAGFTSAAGGKQVAGVIGTELFSRFRTTIDYPKGALILEPPDAPSPHDQAIEIPFLMVRDHFLLARGQLNDGPGQLFFVDTGLAGYAFTGPAATLRDAGIAVPTLPADSSSDIGESAVAPFDIRALILGRARREDMKGLYGPFPPQLESSTGVHIGGIVSHAFFRPYAVTFDFARMRIILRKPKA